MFPYQMFNKTYMNNNMNLNNINNSQMSLLSLINSPVLVSDHNHPLIYSFTLDRAKFGANWRCNKCSSFFAYTIPSFYCIFCDFDLCEQCLLKHQIFEVILYDYNYHLFELTLNSTDQLFNWQSIFPCHQHLLTLIKKTNNNYNWKCNICNMFYNNSQAFYYCSLCDFYLCQKCVIQWMAFMNSQLKMNLFIANNMGDNSGNNNGNNSGSGLKVDNPKYLSGDQLK